MRSLRVTLRHHGERAGRELRPRRGRWSDEFRFVIRDAESNPLPDHPLGRVGVADGSVVDLEITTRSFTPDGEHTPAVFRRDPDFGSPGMSPATRRSLWLKAFGHLIPRRSR